MMQFWLICLCLFLFVFCIIILSGNESGEFTMKTFKMNISLVLVILSIISLFAFSLIANEREDNRYMVKFDIRDADFEEQVREFIPWFDVSAFISELAEGHGYIVSFALCPNCNTGSFRAGLMSASPWMRTGHTMYSGLDRLYREIRSRIYAITCSFCGSLVNSWNTSEIRYVH